MTREDIIKLAREAGFAEGVAEIVGLAGFERLVELARADERNECAALVDANAMACHSPIYRSLLQSNADAIRARGKDPMPLFDDWNKDWK